MLRRAAEIDEAEDAEYGDDARGDELPEELRRREVRLAKMREAKLLEERARRRARERAEGGGSGPEEAEAAAAKAVPRPKEQSLHRPGQPDHEEFPRLDTGLQCSGSGGSGERSDRSPRGDAPERRQPQIGPYAGALGPKPGRYRNPGNRAVSPVIHGRCGILQRTQSGYARRQFDAYVATGRERHHQAGIGQQVKVRTPLRSAMRSKLQTPEGREVYARRKVITEPVHGLIKHVRGFRQFLLRGIHKVAGEFTLVSLTHNLLKLCKPGGRGFVKPGLKRQILSTGPFRGATARVKDPTGPILDSLPSPDHHQHCTSHPPHKTLLGIFRHTPRAIQLEAS